VRSLHYPIALATDFDMQAIEQRVRDKAHLFAEIAGLRFKAFLASSRAEGAAANSYSPFYVWDDDAAMSAFLRGPLFGAVIDSFGRPAVHDAPVLAFGLGDRRVEPRLATFETVATDPVARPDGIARAEETLHRAALDTPGLFAACTTLDTVAWTVTRVRLWADEAGARDVPADARRLRVLRAVGPALA
jgi:hypothetical protein